MGAGMTDPSQMAPLALAWIGDAVYELIVRRRILSEGSRPVQKLHREGIRYVNAAAQAALLDSLEERLTDEEKSVCRRGRNANVNTAPKNQSLADYHKATGFEALIGWLYLKGDIARILELCGESGDHL